MRDEDSTTYVGRIENAEEFGPEFTLLRHGVRDCKGFLYVSIIGDGALWIWNIADEHFYGDPTQIVDPFSCKAALLECCEGAFYR